LEERPTVCARILHVDVSRPETIHIGLFLHAEFLPDDFVSPGSVQLAFSPVDGPGAGRSPTVFG
jgi:hypothetical protein